jgi:RNA polymerase sigma-70 factor (ECF subfamily)
MAVPWSGHFMLEYTLLRQWIESAKTGDEAAFERILVMHEKLVLRVARRILPDPEDAKDAAQEVFLRLHRNLQRFEADKQLTPWLYRMTVNIALDVCRRSKRNEAFEPNAEPVDRTPDPEQTLLGEQRRRIIAAALTRLSPKERAAIVLRDMEGLSTADVARILESSETTVRSHISTGKAKLKSIVEARLRRQR